MQRATDVGPLPMQVGAVLVLVGSPAAGLGCLAAASILAIASAILHAWIVLVEVLR